LLPVELITRPNPEWSIVRANDIYYKRTEQLEGARLCLEILELPELSTSWANDLRKVYQQKTR